MRRMDRYIGENTVREKRSEKNVELYQNLSNNPKYTNITDVTNANAFEINQTSNKNSNYRSRESYQQMKKYQNIEPVPRVKKELDDFNYYYQKNENKNKIYDINSVLENARKNRLIKDELEDKRKLKNTSYNILAGLNSEELEKYREEKKNRVTKPEEEDEIKELIDTITSNTLAQEVSEKTSADLLSDLMATNVMDKVENPEEIDKKEEEKTKEQEEVVIEEISISKEEILEKEKELDKEESKKEEEGINLKDADPDFYTRSMDLSDEDFEMSDDFKEKGLPLIVKIIVFLLIIAVVAVAGYFIYQRII